MKRAIIIILVCLCAGFICQAGGKHRPKAKLLFYQKDFEKESLKESVQGTAVWGDYLFSLRNTGLCVVIDLKKKSLVSEFALASYGVENHANDAFFSGRYYQEGDLFPLLYVSQCKSKPVTEIGTEATDTLSRLLFVERVLTDEDGKPCGTQLVQVISYVPKEWNSRLWIYDPYNPGEIYCYGNIKGNAKEGNRIAFKVFDFPELDKDRFVVELSDGDVKDSFYFDEYLPKGSRGPQNNILQGGFGYKGLIFLPVGVGHDQYPSELFWIDIKNRDRYGYFDYTDVIPCEMEDMDIWGKKAVCTTNSRDKTRPVFAFSLKEFFLSLQRL